MRRETDFVLEKAAWPTMLLEAGGGICRANQAARRVFGLTDDLPATPLTAIWDDDNTASAVNFLQQQTEGETAPLKLRLHGGQKSQFVAHVAKVVRDGQDYFVLQLFKESGSAFSELAYVPVPKTPATGTDNNRIPAGLTQAAWPALVVDAQGKIIHANPSAARVFGARAAAEGAALAGICPPAEAAALGKLLLPASQAAAAPFKICQADGSTAPFRIERCPAGDLKWILLQFFSAEHKSEPPDTAPPEKNEEDFLLQSAEWPVLLVHKNGRVLRANRAGVRAFGASIEREEAQLEAIWSPHNRDSCQQFLNLPPPAEPVPLQFHLKSGLPGDYWGQLCATGQEDVFLLQLLKGPSSGSETTVEPKPPAEAAEPAAGGAARG